MRRTGDTRPMRRRGPLTFHPMADQPIRWLPRHGEPFCLLEWLSQQLIRWTAHLPIYTAIVATLTLIVVVLTR